MEEEEEEPEVELLLSEVLSLLLLLLSEELSVEESQPNLCFLAEALMAKREKRDAQMSLVQATMAVDN